MGTYKIYTDGGGVIEFTTGNDEFFNVGNGQLIADLNSQDGGLKTLTITTAMNKMEDIQDGDGTLVGTMQAENFNKSMIGIENNNLVKAQNVYLENQQKIIKASAQSAIRNTQAILNSQDANTSMLHNLKKTIEDTSLNETMVQALILESLQKIQEAIESKTTTINATGGVNVSLDTAPIVQSLNTMAQNQSATNTKIVEGIENQKETNAKIVENITKKNDHLDFLKNGDSNVKDSSGNIIKPREIEAKKNAESWIDQIEINGTKMEDLIDYVQDFFPVTTDAVGDVLGSTDGFNLFQNPLEIIDRILVEDYINNQDGEKQQ
ncbi:hypothetical protein [Arcobacter ellisii]|uniref:Uncharacterized protein n=1 Tax=Arcobacter ellisii TaxID=913109 RepID=A0A347U8I7_9BACT|nr:hypothetical protein [Arcobacter ellisii]AXX95165.1 hypothetical protein AELL_1505 [Arcobacter ellisii]RXI30181.1 hypothetical protein CP962_09255 [Arcobacter ellisii]